METSLYILSEITFNLHLSKAGDIVLYVSLKIYSHTGSISFKHILAELSRAKRAAEHHG